MFLEKISNMFQHPDVTCHVLPKTRPKNRSKRGKPRGSHGAGDGSPSLDLSPRTPWDWNIYPYIDSSNHPDVGMFIYMECLCNRSVVLGIFAHRPNMTKHPPPAIGLRHFAADRGRAEAAGICPLSGCLMAKLSLSNAPGTQTERDRSGTAGGRPEVWRRPPPKWSRGPSARLLHAYGPYMALETVFLHCRPVSDYFVRRMPTPGFWKFE